MLLEYFATLQMSDTPILCYVHTKVQNKHGQVNVYDSEELTHSHAHRLFETLRKYGYGFVEVEIRTIKGTSLLKYTNIQIT